MKSQEIKALRHIIIADSNALAASSCQQNKKIKVYVAADKFRLDTRGNEYYQSKDDNKKT